MKNIIYLITVLFLSCGSGKQETGNAEGPSFPTETITQETHEKNVKLINEAFEKAKSNAINNKIIYGYEVGMSEPSFDACTTQLTEQGKLKKSGNDPYKGEYVFDLGNGITENVDIHCSSSGIFRKFPLISFRTIENCKDMKKVEDTRNKFIEWAIKQYGETFYITLNHSSPDGGDLSKATNNYTWIVGSYSVDIVIGSCSVALTYRLVNEA